MMDLTSAKCPNCNAMIQLDSSRVTGFCLYCGRQVVVEEAIQKLKVELFGKVEVDGIASIENLMTRGKQCSWPGKLFIKGYYLISPPIARALQRSQPINGMVKRVLDKWVARLEMKNKNY